jgi:DNA helicase HerA-like ATPase
MTSKKQTHETRLKLGIITKGSLLEGVEMKLDAKENVEDIKAGKFVVVEGDKNDFFSMITDIKLSSTSETVLLNPPDKENELMRKIIQGTSTFATISLRPMLMIERDGDDQEPKPVKTVPAHFSLVADAEEKDVSNVFGKADDKKFFNIGTPLDMETPVCINLDRLVERSNAVFGKSGTGKTFITRLLLAGTIKSDKAVNLIFDMHNEYGTKGRKESGTNRDEYVKGLKDIFPEKVKTFSLDPESTRTRGGQPDYEVHINIDEIDVEDITMIQYELNLNPTAAESSYILKKNLGRFWLRDFMAMNKEKMHDFSESYHTNESSLATLHRKLERLYDLPFIIKDPAPKSNNVIRELMNCIEQGKSVVFEFGRYSNPAVYILIANILTRRIREEYRVKSEKFMNTQKPEDKPRQLMITIEEAHKFLNPRTASQTIFGEIAREMRKYFVSLLIVDQRPSGIDDEVLSQIGTKIIALLNDEKDIAAVLTGVSNPQGLRSVLASLDSKQQALVLGHAVPMPVVVKTREYDEKFYKDIGRFSGEAFKQKAKSGAEEIFD